MKDSLGLLIQLPLLMLLAVTHRTFAIADVSQAAPP